MSYLICRGHFVLFSEFRWEVIVRFVDIGEIDDHHYLNFRFITVLYIGSLYYIWYTLYKNIFLISENFECGEERLAIFA